ncbi:hypothetical protein VNI00_003576 [Paramarasmius palmivorus]|uniref:FHA domain-containing protein n=1 Tax=Paramarasmius palmivorus TaxID=297713 RepID=A0AAW0DNY2_9AGAR
MPSLIFRRQSTVRHRPTSLDTGYSYTASIDATTPNHEDFFSNDTLPAQSSLLTTSFVSPLRKAMKLSGVLEQIPSSVGSTSTHRSSVPPPITSSRRKEVRSIGPIFTTKPNRPTKPFHSTLTRAPIAHERRTSNDLPDLHVQVYLPAEQLKVGPLKLEICAEATVKELVSLALRTDRDSEITGRWILRPVQDHFVDYENLALSPLDKVQTFDTRVFALSSVDFEGTMIIQSGNKCKHRKRSTHRRCYTLLSNGEEVLDMDGTNGQFRPRAKLFRVRVDLANSADIIQIHV